METKNTGMRVIEYACWAFFALCAVGVGRWLILEAVSWAGWEKPDWAAWVQAIGSIVAILGMFALANMQAHRADVAAQIAKWEHKDMQAILASTLADDVVQCLDDVVCKMTDRRLTRRRPIRTERLEQLLHALQSFAEEDHTPSTLQLILNMQREVAYTISAVRELGRGVASDDRITNAKKRVDSLRKYRWDLIDMAHRCQTIADHLRTKM